MAAAGTHPASQWLNSLSAHLGLISPAAAMAAGMLNPAGLGGATQLMPLHHPHAAMAAAAAGANPSSSQILDVAEFAQLQLSGGGSGMFPKLCSMYMLGRLYWIIYISYIQHKGTYIFNKANTNTSAICLGSLSIPKIPLPSLLILQAPTAVACRR